MRSGIAALLALLAPAWAAAAHAAAEPCVDPAPTPRFALAAPAAWERVRLPDEPTAVLLACRDARRDRLLVVTRVAGPAGVDFAESVQALVAGLSRGGARARLLEARRRTLGTRTRPVTAADLRVSLERDGRRRTLAARFLLLRGWVLGLVVELPGTVKVDRETRALVESFGVSR